MPPGPIRPAVDRIGPPSLDDFADRHLGFVDLFRGVGCLGSWDGDEPVDVGVREIEGAAAGGTSGAGTFEAEVLADEGLRQPEGQPLFSYPWRSGQKGRLRKPAGGDRASQPVP